ncbi:DNA-binding response regulator [Bifidobacterium lemurum]|uniref:DNA-binding response regulator n=1 Tax=Bifidobacterium lemurum TaxID=1603886 RepID=A0A261FNC5_9BIFI|nr:LytTR family DNA-binding domain-containing protein [Bifidobacterium lemurum]OZG60672.1 DNA-binding response regulator [Bifidobacterium lemurum]QOL34810.1 response regulator transcription factor [Bifidobacterium lemurum]
MLRIAVIEDTPLDRNQLLTVLQSYAESHAMEYQVSEFANADMFLDRYRPIWDLIFMDIEMPGSNGMQAAHLLRQMDADVPLVFLTKVASLATDGYDVNALAYIIKPVTPEVFSLKMRHVLAHIGKRTEASLTISGRNSTTRVSISSIAYVEVNRHTIIFHTNKGNVTSYGTLRTIEEQLSPYGFLRCSQSFLVNPQYVSGVQGDNVLIHDERLPISRSRKREFLQSLAAYLGAMQ